MCEHEPGWRSDTRVYCSVKASCPQLTRIGFTLCILFCPWTKYRLDAAVRLNWAMTKITLHIYLTHIPLIYGQSSACCPCRTCWESWQIYSRASEWATGYDSHLLVYSQLIRNGFRVPVRAREIEASFFVGRTSLHFLICQSDRVTKMFINKTVSIRRYQQRVLINQWLSIDSAFRCWLTGRGSLCLTTSCW